MTTNYFQDGFTQEAASDNQSAMRFLIDDPARGWRLFSMKKAMVVHRGALLLPEYANQTVRVVSAYVTTQHSKVIGLHQLEVAEWKFDSDGRVDRQALMSGIVKKLNQSAKANIKNQNNMSDGLIVTDINAIRVALGLAITSQ